MSPRFGRCFFTSEYLRVHGGLLNNEVWWRKQRGLEVFSPLGRSCVNPLREAHTKLVPLALFPPFSLSPSLLILSLTLPS